MCEDDVRYRTAAEATAPVGVTVTETRVFRDWLGTLMTIEVFVGAKVIN